jgi:hypothetical protein
VHSNTSFRTIPIFDHLKRELAGNCGKPFEEIFQGIPALQIVEQRLDWNPGSTEDRRTVHDVRIPSDRLLHGIIVSKSTDGLRGEGVYL